MNLFTKYVPPNKMLPINLLEELNVKYENTIVMGDLNAKIGEIGGKTTNRNGELLTYLLETTSLMIVVSVISGMFLGLFKPYEKKSISKYVLSSLSKNQTTN